MIKLSRTKLELSLECPRCFWLDLNKNLRRPPPAPYTINSAIDSLLKAEFDVHRKNGTAHSIMEKYQLDAIPYNCAEITEWRNNFSGVRFEHRPTGFLVYGAIDDVWINSAKELIVVDYKATGAKEHKIYDSYRRQMEIYQWLFKQNGFRVSQTGYFLFARVNKANGFADGKLSFDLFLEPVAGDTGWIEGALAGAREILDGTVPPSNPGCPYCQFAAGI